jgi:hypothetical protein
MNGQIYYHFLPSEFAINDLENEWIKVSTLGELNDPFELKPYLRYGFKERQPYHKVFREISKKWGLLCFSNDWNEPILWSYYAKKHTGIAIGFNILQDQVLKVNYGSDPKRQQIKLTNDKKTNEKLVLSLANVKYKKWEYENEYRLLVELKDCISKDYLPQEKRDLCLIKFGERLKVKEIVLGCNFDHEKEKKRIINLAIKLTAKIIPTREQWEGYKINPCGTKTVMYKNLMSSTRLKDYCQ